VAMANLAGGSAEPPRALAPPGVYIPPPLPRSFLTNSPLISSLSAPASPLFLDA
jgi:hypothetical protein